MRDLLHLFLFLFLFSACEKVIDVDLNEANPAVVIGGNLSFSGGAEVKISRTGSYFGAGSMEKVSGAEVILQYSSGKQVRINETEPGWYKKEELVIGTGIEYQLTVTVDGTAYRASSTMNPVVPIDSIGYAYFEGILFFDEGYRVKLFFPDPPRKENFYRIKVYKNGELENRVEDLIVFDDSGIEGRFVEVTMRGQVFAPGDTARVELISIDQPAFDYFSNLRDIANNNPGSPAPANPPSNFSNGALGYFSAWSCDSKTIVIEP